MAPKKLLSPRFRRTLQTVALCAAALAAGGILFGLLAGLKEPPQKRDAVTKIYNVEVYGVERRELPDVVSSFGTARADRELPVSAEVAGKVTKINPRLRIGREVTPDDLLVQIDRSTYEERVEQANSRLAEIDKEIAQLEQEIANNAAVIEKAAADVKQYREEYERVRELYEKDRVGSKSDVNRARLELRRYELALTQAENDRRLFPVRRMQLQARKKTARSELELAKLDVERTAVRPPFTGIISEVQVERGQFLKAGDPIVTITNVSLVEIPVPVPLEDYEKIAPVVQAAYEKAAQYDREVDTHDLPLVRLARNETAAPIRLGRVYRVAPRADELTRTVEVFVQVDNALHKLTAGEAPVQILPGMFVNARIEAPPLPGVIAVPRDALVERLKEPLSDEQADATAWPRQDGQRWIVYVAASAGDGALPSEGGRQGTENSSGSIAGEAGGRSPARGGEEQLGTAERRVVVVTRTLGNLAVIGSGLRPGERVILTNLDVMHDGATVSYRPPESVLADERDSRGAGKKRPHIAERPDGETRRNGGEK